jgi:hypothetical protein
LPSGTDQHVWQHRQPILRIHAGVHRAVVAVLFMNFAFGLTRTFTMQTGNAWQLALHLVVALESGWPLTTAQVLEELYLVSFKKKIN